MTSHCHIQWSVLSLHLDLPSSLTDDHSFSCHTFLTSHHTSWFSFHFKQFFSSGSFLGSSSSSQPKIGVLRASSLEPISSNYSHSAVATPMSMVFNTTYILITSHLVPLFWISPFNPRIICCLPGIFIWLSESICRYHHRTSAIKSLISNLFSPSSIISVSDTSIYLLSYTCPHSLDPNHKPYLWVNTGHWLRSQGSPSSQCRRGKQPRHRTIPASQKNI